MFKKYSICIFLKHNQQHFIETPQISAHFTLLDFVIEAALLHTTKYHENMHAGCLIEDEGVTAKTIRIENQN